MQKENVEYTDDLDGDPIGAGLAQTFRFAVDEIDLRSAHAERFQADTGRLSRESFASAGTVRTPPASTTATAGASAAAVGAGVDVVAGAVGGVVDGDTMLGNQCDQTAFPSGGDVAGLPYPTAAVHLEQDRGPFGGQPINSL